MKLKKIKDKEKILKAARGKEIIFRGPMVRITANFSTEIMETKNTIGWLLQNDEGENNANQEFYSFSAFFGLQMSLFCLHF